MKSLLLLAFLTLPVFAAEKEAPPAKIGIYGSMEELAKVLNSPAGISDNFLKKMQAAKGDEKYLKSIAHQRLLAKGDKAVPLANGIVITAGRGPTTAVFVKSLEPLELETLSGKKIKVDTNNIWKSVSGKSSASNGPAVNLFSRLSSALVPAAFASEENLEAKVVFLVGLMQKNASAAFDPGSAGAIAALRGIFQEMDFESKISCSADKYPKIDLHRKGMHLFYTTGWLDRVYCTPNGEKPNENSIINVNTSSITGTYCAAREKDGANYRQISEELEAAKKELEKQKVAAEKLNSKNLVPAVRQFLDRAAKAVELDPAVGQMELANGTCELHFVKKPMLSLEKMAEMKKAASEYCAAQRFEAPAMISPAPEYQAKVKALETDAMRLGDLDSYVRNRVVLFRHMAVALGQCCHDNNCRVEAFEKGLRLNAPDASDDAGYGEDAR